MSELTAPPGELTALAGELEAGWRRTDEIFAMLQPEALMARPVSGLPPFVFHLGHLPAHAWRAVRGGLLGEDASSRPEFDDLFGDPPRFEPDQERGPRETVTRWPRVEEVVAYRDEIRAAVRAAVPELEAAGQPDGTGRAERALRNVVEHEQLVQELLLGMVLQLGSPLKRRPPTGLPEPSFEPAASPRQVTIPRGEVDAGRSDRGSRVVDVPAFRIDSTPVMNGDFFEFLQAGGYEDPKYWTTEDWRWRRSVCSGHPIVWSRDDEGWWYLGLFDRLPLTRVFDWPVYTSLAEARAFLRWRGGRLPTEDELARATYGSPSGDVRRHPWGDEAPEARHGNFAFHSWSPTPVGSHPDGESAFGVLETVGNGWEWTSSTYQHQPGPECEDLQGHLSADEADGRHHVLVGASWATGTRLLRRGFRIGRLAHDPYVFGKFRGVTEA